MGGGALNPRHLGPAWIEMRAELVAPVGRDEGRSIGTAFYPQAAPELLIISDIDDTVLQSRVTNFLRAAQTLAFGNARTRLPFPGVAAFYQALHRGATGRSSNPLFYVSSSPWNLYDVITQFLEIQGIPHGPLMLRDVDIGIGALSSMHHHAHKREMIRRVLTTYPAVPAVLIGDSGQQDPEIYRDVVHEYSGRIRAVYIRDVSQHPERSRVIRQLAVEVLAAGSSLVLTPDTLAAASHAAEVGLIDHDALAEIAAEKRADE
jgi:phosphatidate phosphatase APP1